MNDPSRHSSHHDIRHKSSRYRHSHHRLQRHQSRSPAPPNSPSLSPNTAFRESLFDALADDEGAAYWEGVYGQPIHTYPHPRHGTSSGIQDENVHYGSENSVLGHMSDEEYASYVRARMWEKSHSYIMEERQRREQIREDEQQRRKEVDGKRAFHEEEATRIERMMHESATRGIRRKERAGWKKAWKRYEKEWQELRNYAINPSNSENNHVSMEKNTRVSAPKIPWPVRSGRLEDISKAAVEEFMRLGSAAAVLGEEIKEIELLTVLKNERVRWHPDKMMRLHGSQGLQENTLRTITEIFQILDVLWTKWKDALEPSK